MTVDGDVHVLLQVLTGMAGRLAEQPDAEGVCAAVLPAAVEALGGQVGTLALLDGPRTLRVLATVGMSTQLADRWVEFDISAAVPIAGCVRDAEPVWLPDIDAGRARFPALPSPSRSRSLCAVPLRAGHTVIGALAVGWARPRAFDDAEQHLLSTVAGLAAAACTRHRPPAASTLVPHVHVTPPGVRIGCLTRPENTRCIVATGRDGDVATSGSVFATLLGGATASGEATDAVAGLVALARLRGQPPALLAQDVAAIVADSAPPVSGAHLQLDAAQGWIAVVPLDGETVLACTPSGGGDPCPSDGGSPGGERLVFGATASAAVLAAILEPGTDQVATAAIRQAAHEACLAHPRFRGDVSALLDAFAVGLHATETGVCVRGVLAAVLDPAPPRGARRRVLPASAVACVLARRFAAAALPPDAAPDIVGDVELIADELVANAISHAVGGVTLTVCDDPSGTLIAVGDSDPELPQRLCVGSDVESGRGLLLVEELADETGVTPDKRQGKTVWARLNWRDHDTHRPFGSARYRPDHDLG